MIEYLSPSSISLFKTCPRKFYYEKIEKRDRGPSGVDAVIGTFVHRILELFMTLPAEQRSKQALAKLLRSEWETFRTTTEYTFGNFDEASFKSRVSSGLSGYMTMEDPMKTEPLHLEREIKVEIDGIPFFGYIDRIVTVNGWNVCQDLKTGKVPAEKYKNDKLLQLKFYAAALATLNEPVEEIELMYVTYGESISQIVVQEDIDEARSILYGTWAAVNDPKQEWPTKTGPLCAFCNFEDICPQGKIAADKYRAFRAYKGDPL